MSKGSKQHQSQIDSAALASNSDAILGKKPAEKKAQAVAPVICTFYSMGELRAALKAFEHVPDDVKVLTQVTGTNCSTWNMESALIQTPLVKGGIILAIHAS